MYEDNRGGFAAGNQVVGANKMVASGYIFKFVAVVAVEDGVLEAARELLNDCFTI